MTFQKISKKFFLFSSIFFIDNLCPSVPSIVFPFLSSNTWIRLAIVRVLQGLRLGAPILTDLLGLNALKQADWSELAIVRGADHNECGVPRVYGFAWVNMSDSPWPGEIIHATISYTKNRGEGRPIDCLSPFIAFDFMVIYHQKWFKTLENKWPLAFCLWLGLLGL